MTACDKLFEGLEKRLQERKSLDEIGKELCSRVKDPRGKVIRLIKLYKEGDAEGYLRRNADWLGYDTDKATVGEKGGLHSQENFAQKNSSKELQEDNGGRIESNTVPEGAEEEYEDDGIERPVEHGVPPINLFLYVQTIAGGLVCFR